MSSKPDFRTMTDEAYEAYWIDGDQLRQRLMDEAAEREKNEQPMEIVADANPTCNPLPVLTHDYAMAPVAIAEMHGWKVEGWEEEDVFMSGPNGRARTIAVSRKTGEIEALPF